MKKFMQKIDSFAKRFFSEISEADVLPEYDINNPNLAGAEAISETMLGELKKAEINHELEKNENIKRIDGKELDR